MITAKVQRKSSGKLDKIKSSLRGPSKVKVGLPSGEAPSEIVSIGIWNHFGTSRGTPPRPFLANAVRDHAGDYRDAMKKSAKAILAGSTTLRGTLSKLGIFAQGHIRAEIIALKAPPNAPSTIRRKGSSNPLVDTGRLGQSITYKVED